MPVEMIAAAVVASRMPQPIYRSGLPAWLLVTDAEGMSVLTAWAAGKFDAESIAKAVKQFGVADKIDRKAIDSRHCIDPFPLSSFKEEGHHKIRWG